MVSALDVLAVGSRQAAVNNQVELACGRVDDQAVDGDVVGHQRMFSNQLNGMAHTVFNVVKTGQPAVQIDTGVAQGFDAVVRDIAVVYALEELFGV